SRGKGVAKKLLSTVLTTASERYGAKRIRFITDGTKRYPIEWYKKLGFSKTGWVHMSGNIEEALQKLK
ncbi:MAG: GNAT family N-acetyltransferase, partial [Candidatus Berkelbacteria bacterium]|nr:GNAT family N-acetyltransferase [Candidatus Berkelbacteria bacterium]